MRRFIFVLALELMLPMAAWAQLQSAPVPAANVNPQPPSCAAPNFLGWSGTAWTCTAAPAASNVTVTGGPCISVTGGPAYVVQGSFSPVTKTGAYTIQPGDVCKQLILSGASAPFTLPAAGTAPFTAGAALGFAVKGPGQLTIQGTNMYGSAVGSGGTQIILNPGQSIDAQVDDQSPAGWLITGNP